MNNVKAKKRIGWIDLARFFGIFYIVLGHTYVTEHFLQLVVYLFEVPLFFAISGVTYKYKSNQLQFIKEKLIRLYLPYLFCSIVSIFIYLCLGSIIGENVRLDIPNILNCLYGMIYANVSAGNMMWNRPLWFLPTLLVALILMNLIQALPKTWMKNVAAVVLSGIGYILSLQQIFLPLQFETALSMLIWVYIGYTLKNYYFKIDKEWSTTKKWIAMNILTVIGAGIGFYNGTISVMVDLYGKSIPLYLIDSFCMITATFLFCMIIKHQSFLELIGRNTLTILLWHKFPILFFQKVCPGIKEFLASPNLLISEPATFGVAIFSIISCLILKYIYDYAKDRFFKSPALPE